jgi:aromatic ring hydroxylase
VCLRAGALSLAPRGAREGASESAQPTLSVVVVEETAGGAAVSGAVASAFSERNVDYECKRENGFGGTDFKQ